MSNTKPLFYVVKSGNVPPLSDEYYEYVRSKMNTHEWIYSIGKFLESIDLTGFDPTKFPETMESRILNNTGVLPGKSKHHKKTHRSKN